MVIISSLPFSFLSFLWSAAHLSFHPSMEVSSLLLFDSPLISFTLMFGVIYLIGYSLVLKNWGSSRCEARSCFISLFHGSPAAIMAMVALIESRKNGFFQLDYGAENTGFQDFVLEFSMGYFIIDLLHYVIFIPKDVLFIAHHLATLYVLVTCRYVVHHGGVALLGLVVLAEITSPCQNTWSLARLRRLDLPEAARYYEFLSPYFLAYYSVVRGILGPVYVLKMVAVLAANNNNNNNNGLVPLWAWISWLIVVGVGIWVSILWVMNRWVDLLRTRAIVMNKVS